MPEAPQQAALLSLSDTTGGAALAKALERRGFAIFATSGTRAFLERNRIVARDVEALTGFGPLFGGLVKTLHPNLFGGILFDRNSPEHEEEAHSRGIVPISVVAVTLYRPPEIDIGGVALLRAAAKNYAHVSVLSDPLQYSAFIEWLGAGGTSLEQRKALAAAALSRTAEYDRENVARISEAGRMLSLSIPLRSALRYGENPQQIGAFYAARAELIPEQLHGKALSYNNLLDLDATLRLLWRSPLASGHAESVRAVVVKHTIPCGVAQRKRASDALREALEADRISAYGGVVALDAPLDPACAEILAPYFLEIVAAPGFVGEALETLQKKRNLRIMRFAKQLPLRTASERSFRTALGGILVEEPDPQATPEELRVVSSRQPTETEWSDLRFAWDVVRNVKSNAVVIVHDQITRGICAGQTNRVSAVEIAAARAGNTARGAACASDGFFPFADGLEAAVKAGCGAVIAPSGSIRDEEVVAAAERSGIALVFSSHRHFSH